MGSTTHIVQALGQMVLPPRDSHNQMNHWRRIRDVFFSSLLMPPFRWPHLTSNIGTAHFSNSQHWGTQPIVCGETYTQSIVCCEAQNAPTQTWEDLWWANWLLHLYVVKVLKTAPFSFADAITLNAITLKRNSAMRKPKLSPFMWFRFFFTACNAGLGVWL